MIAVADSSPVYSGIGSNLDVVLDHDAPGLADLVKTTVFRGSKAKPVTAYNNAVLQDYPAAKNAAFPHSHLGVKH